MVTADFYVNGAEVAESDATREATLRIHQGGHRVENHAWSHIALDGLPLADVQSELRRTQDLITEVTGRAPTRLRPPFGAGAFSRPPDPELSQAAGELGLSLTLWQVDTNDWRSPRGLRAKMRDIMAQVARNRDRAMTDVLMHVQTETANDLPDFIARLRNDGYSIG